MTAELELKRVARHIERAEQLAAARDLSSLSRLQRLLRQLLLRVLAEYRAAGRFPLNRDFVEQRPYFVDADGTRCAMAHLLEHGGEHDLVAKIARERNHAYVRELADEPRLLAWLAAAGLTVEEAAAIQPGYCSAPADCLCGGAFSSADYPMPASGVLEVVVYEGNVARIEQIYGDGLGRAIGDDVELISGRVPGDRVLVPIDSATVAPYNNLYIEADGSFSCRPAVTGEVALSQDQLLNVLQAPDCRDALLEINEEWGIETCTGEGHEDPLGDAGCNGSGADAMSVGILLALVTVLVRRR